jgi:hypothetical protein
MSVFAAPFTIVLPAASTSEVLGVLPVGTTAAVIVSTTSITGAFQYPGKFIGFLTPSAQMMAGVNPMFVPTAGNQPGGVSWHNARVGAGSVSGVSTVRFITATTFAGTSLGLTKDGVTAADVTFTIYPIVSDGACDLREGSGLVSAGTALTVTDLPIAAQRGFLYLTGDQGANGTATGARITFAFAASPSSQWGVAIAQDWNVNPSNALSRVLTDRLGPSYGLSGPNVVHRAGRYSLGSVSPTGYTITQNAATTNSRFAVLAIPGNFAVLQGVVPSAAGLHDTDGAGFTPSSGLFALSAFTTTNDVEADSYSLSLGGGTIDGQRVSRIQNPDNTSTPQPTVAALGGAVLQGANASGQTSLANIDAFLADGVRLNWTDADATPGLWAALVSGGAPPAPSGPSPAAIQYYRRLNGLTP